jgi:hypothetical protein
MINYPIAVASKGRPDSKLLLRIQTENLPFRIFCEPQDANTYRQRFPGVIIQLDADNQGLAYARNAILGYARASGASKFWMLDDDVEDFFEGTEKGYLKVTVAEALGKAEPLLGEMTQGALEYSQFAWSHQPGDCSDGSYCDVCVLIDIGRTKDLTFRDEVNLKLDRDFTLQVLASGGRTRRISNIGFSCPENGSNKGGLYEAYKSGREKADCEALAKFWPHCVTVQQKKSGRWDAKIDWRNVRQSKMAFA